MFNEFRKSRQAKAILPFDSTMSPSRSNRLFPKPIALQNTTVFSISSSSRTVFFCLECQDVRVSGFAVSNGPSWLAVQDASPCGFGRLRRSVSTSEESRKQPANITGVRGERLLRSNPITQRLRQPRRRARSGSRVQWLAVPCRARLRGVGGWDDAC